MVHPDTELRFIDAAVGHGIFATRLIPAGSLIWVKDDLDQIITHDVLAALPPTGRETALKYSAQHAPGRFILFWDHARFINHSCAPASLIAGPHFSIAVRDIPAGSEITEDYGLLNLLPEETFDCRCGAPRCRRRVGPDDAAAVARAWAPAVRRALAMIDGVAQPLQPLMREEDLGESRARWKALANGS